MLSLRLRGLAMRNQPTTLLILAGLLLAGPAFADGLLLDGSRTNAKWIIDSDGNGAAVSGVDARTPELEFNFAQLKRGPLELTLRTDASQVAVRVPSSGPRIDLKPNQENTLIIWVGPEPYVEVNGERDAAATGDLASALERARSDEQIEKMSLRFSRIDGALLKWRQLPAPVMDATAIDAADDLRSPDGAGLDAGDAYESAPAPVDTAALIARVRGGLVELRIRRAAEDAVSVVCSPVLTDRYYVVAPAEALRGAAAVDAAVAGVDEPLVAKLVTVDLNVGLALLELDATFAPAARAALRPLALADQTPRPGDRVWIASMLAGQPRLSAAPVDAVVGYDELDRDLKAALTPAAASKWIQVQGGVSTQQSNAACLNAGGELVGLAVWAWADRAEVAGILSAEHIRPLIENPPAEPMTLAMLNEMLASIDLPHLTFPTIEPVADQSADYLRRINGALRTSAECRVCDGTGVRADRKLVGYETTGNLRKSIYHVVYLECGTCEGTGLRDPQTLGRSLDSVVSTAARLNSGTGDVVATLEAVRDNLRQLTLGHYDAMTALVNGEAKALIAGGPANIGQPIVMVGSYFDQVQLPGEPQPLMGVKLENPDDRRAPAVKALVTRPRLVEAGDSRTAMVTGLLAGFVQQAPDQPPVAVVSHGLVIPIDTTQVVERKTVEQLNQELEEQREKRAAEIERERQRIERERELRDRQRYNY